VPPACYEGARQLLRFTSLLGNPGRPRLMVSALARVVPSLCVSFDLCGHHDS
jgi:hypothetical protein